MDPEKRVLKLNPELFSLVNNTTRKKRTTDGGGGQQPIKMKQNAGKKREDTLKKKSILRMIRAHQSEQYNSLFDKKKENKSIEEEDTFNKEFEEATEYLSHLMKQNTQNAKKENTTPHHNRTLKHYNTHPMIPPPTATQYMSDLISAPYTPEPPPIHSSPFHIRESPHYGCLKNGNLPTFRTYMKNTTQRNYSMSPHPPHPAASSVMRNQPTIESNHLAPDQIINQKIQQSIEQVENNSGPTDTMKEQYMMQKKVNELAAFSRSMRPKIYKQRKIKRRTYKIGKSKGSRKISVLISNKTIRRNVSEKAQNIKQVPISDVKKYLIKRELIKGATSATNDILRKMYESAILMCGEVHNHNSENLLFNFINNDK